jgi:hypothetical protein
VGDEVEHNAILVPFGTGGTRGELLMGVLDPDALLGVPPPLALAALVAYSCAGFSPKRLIDFP